MVTPGCSGQRRDDTPVAQSVAVWLEGWRRAKEVGEMEDRLYALECVV